MDVLPSVMRCSQWAAGHSPSPRRRTVCRRLLGDCAGIGVPPLALALQLWPACDAAMPPTMPTHLPRRVTPASDDPWGFGASDGALVECSSDTLEVARPPARPLPPRAAPSVAPAPPAPPAAPPWSPSITRTAEPARLSPSVVRALAPPRRRYRLARVALVCAALALSGAGGYLWFSDDPRWRWVDTTSAPAATLAGGVFVLSSQPPGAEVLVDGVAAGVTPLALHLTAGTHTIVATAGNGVAERFSAAVPAGESDSRHLMLETPLAAAPEAPASPAAATPPPGPLPAFVVFEAPFEVRVYEDGEFVGTNADGRIRVTSGRHTFTLVNEPLGFRADETVLAGAGRSTRRVITQPSAPLSVNAEPWAEVLIAGRSLGETPIANVALPVGTHQVTLRHPTLGERLVAMTVRLGAPNRLAVDMRR